MSEKNSPFLLIVILLIAFFSIIFLSEYFHNIKVMEKRLRSVCITNQAMIFKALVEYNEIHNDLPKDLSVLVDEGLIREDFLFCPFKYKIQKNDDYREFSYLYFPENFGKKDKVLISRL